MIFTLSLWRPNQGERWRVEADEPYFRFKAVFTSVS
jgi:hypothetical protein